LSLRLSGTNFEAPPAILHKEKVNIKPGRGLVPQISDSPVTREESAVTESPSVESTSKKKKKDKKKKKKKEREKEKKIKERKKRNEEERKKKLAEEKKKKKSYHHLHLQLRMMDHRFYPPLPEHTVLI
jgi:hypothetical protein